MANSLTTQLLVDGPRNAVVKITGVLDTSDQSITTVVDPTTLFAIAGFPTPPLLQIMHVDYSISDQLEVQLQWHATAINRVHQRLAEFVSEHRDWLCRPNNIDQSRASR